MRAWAKGVLCAEAAVELLIGHRWWLCRKDFARVAVEPGRNIFTGTVVAAGDFEGGGCALGPGGRACPPCEGPGWRGPGWPCRGAPIGSSAGRARPGQSQG